MFKLNFNKIQSVIHFSVKYFYTCVATEYKVSEFVLQPCVYQKFKLLYTIKGFV